MIRAWNPTKTRSSITIMVVMLAIVVGLLTPPCAYGYGLDPVFMDMDGANYDDVKAEAYFQTGTANKPRYSNVPVTTNPPEHQTFEGDFTPSSPNGSLMAIFSDDGCDVYVTPSGGTEQLVLNKKDQGQALPNLDELTPPSLIRLPSSIVSNQPVYEWSAGVTYHIKIEYSNIIYTGSLDIDGCTLFAYEGGGSITSDIAGPTGSIQINSNAPYTLSQGVILTLSATDPAMVSVAATGVYQVQFSNDGQTWSSWERYATTKMWTLTAGDGTKTVYVKYKDNGGNLSPVYSDTIVLRNGTKIIHVSSSASDDSLDGFTWETAKKTVQGALNAALSGDEVWVKAGNYNQCITLKSGVGLYGGFADNESARNPRDPETNETTLDATGYTTSVVTVPSGANSSTIIDGFTITNANTYSSGGGVYCSSGASPVISNNKITRNIATSSIDLSVSSGIYGAGNASLTITNNVIADNSGHGIFLEGGPFAIANNTIANNGGMGINIACSCQGTIINNIVAFNAYYGVGKDSYSSLTLSHNDVVGHSTNYWGGLSADETDISSNPSFMDRENSDYRLRDYHLQAGSSCIDAATSQNAPDTDRDGRSRPINNGFDIGAYEFSDFTHPSVLVTSATNQTNVGPIVFTVTFSEPVKGFNDAVNDVIVDGTAGILSADISPTSDRAVYTVSVSGMTTDGDVTLSIPADAATDEVGNSNIASINPGAIVNYNYTFDTISAAAACADGTLVRLYGKRVTAVFPDYLYVQDVSAVGNFGVRGIRVYYSGQLGVGVGQSVDVSGIMSTTGSERCITGTTVETASLTRQPLCVYAMINRTVGGGDWKYDASTGKGQRGITGAYGWNNIGLLVKSWGKVIAVDTSSFTISDGSTDLNSIPVKVIVPTGSVPLVGSYVAVMGISSCEESGSDLVRAIRARSEYDIKTLQAETITMQLLANWNFIGLPAAPDNYSPGAIFGLPNMYLVRFEPTTQSQISWPDDGVVFRNILMGDGYWVNSPSVCSIQYSGYKNNLLGTDGYKTAVAISMPGCPYDYAGPGGYHEVANPFDYSIGLGANNELFFADGESIKTWSAAVNASWCDMVMYGNNPSTGSNYSVGYMGLGEEQSLRARTGYGLYTFINNLALIIPEVDTTGPSVTVTIADGQANPSNTSPIRFTVEFSEPVFDFDDNGDVTIGGTAGATNAGASITDSGDHKTYTVAVSGMTADGDVTLSISAGVSTDANGNGNTASASPGAIVSYNCTFDAISAAAASANGTRVRLLGKRVTAVFPDYLYVQDISSGGFGIKGIRIVFSGASTITGVGQSVDVYGILDTAGGERCITGATVTSASSVVEPLWVYAMINRTVGGGDWKYDASTGKGQRGVTGAYGWNNIGLLVKSWGKVTAAGTSSFTINDGSTDLSGANAIPVKVIVPAGSVPSVGSYVAVMGISSCEESGSDLVRVIRARDESDTKTLQAETVTLQLLPSWNFIGVPAAPDNSSPGAIFGLPNMNLVRFEPTSQSEISWPDDGTVFGNILPGDGYWIDSPSACSIQYSGYKNNLLNTDGYRTAVAISLPGCTDAPGGCHYLANPFDYSIDLGANNELLFTDGELVKTWSASVNASWCDMMMYYLDPTTGSYYTMGYLGFGDEQSLRARTGYSLYTYVNDLALIIPEVGITGPSVTVSKADSQADPANTSPIEFTVTFSEPVFGFDDATDVTIGGTAGADSSTITDSGDHKAYTMAVSGMTADGDVTLSIPAGVSTDANGNGNTASASPGAIVSYNCTFDAISAAAASANGTRVRLLGKRVTAVFPDYLYVQDIDSVGNFGVRGIRVSYSGASAITGVGQSVDVYGILDTVGGEKCITGATVTITSSVREPLCVYAMINRTAGGGDWKYDASTGKGQRGITGAYGWNNIGLLIKSWGKVTAIDTSNSNAPTITISDGSTSFDGTSSISVKVIAPSWSLLPQLNSYVAVMGISSCEESGSDLIRVIRARSDSDIQVLQPETVTLSLLSNWNFIGMPAVPVDPDPTTVFAGIPGGLNALSGNLARKNPIDNYNDINWYSVDPGPFGGMLLGEGYWISPTSNCTISYSAYKNNVTTTDGYKTAVVISLPGNQSEEDPGGFHSVANPFDYDIDLSLDNELYITDGDTVKAWSAAISSSWCESQMSGYNANTDSDYTLGYVDFPETQILSARAAYHFATYVSNLALIIPEVDTTGPSVTVSATANPSNTPKFTVTFSEPVFDFDDATDVTIGGTAGANSASITNSGDHTTYTVTVGGMTADGDVTLSIPANVATDAVGNGNTASAIPDATVSYTCTFDAISNAVANANGTRVRLLDKRVTAVFPDYLYVQDVAAAGNVGVRGIRVNYSGASTITGVGQSADVYGTLGTVGDEKCITNTTVTSASSTRQPLCVYAMINRTVGGDDWKYDSSNGKGQRGITGAYGWNNIGLLVKSWGRVTAVDTSSSSFTISDGSTSFDSTDSTPVKVIVPAEMISSLSSYAENYVAVMGISSCEESGSNLISTIRVRSASDIQVLQPETVTLSLQANANLIGVPAVPADPDPTAVFAGIPGGLSSLSGALQGTNPVNASGTSWTVYGNDIVNILLGEGYWLTSSSDCTISYSAYKNNVTTTDGYKTAVVVSLPGTQYEGYTDNPGGWHYISNPFSYNILLGSGNNVFFTDGQSILTWPEAVSTNWCSGSMSGWDSASGGFDVSYEGGSPTAEIYELEVGQAYQFNTYANNLALVLPEVDTTGPSVTVSKADSQADPANASPIEFTVTFSEPVFDFDDTSDVTIGGTTGATSARITDSGDHKTYAVAVSGMTSNGMVTLGVPAGAATDANGNGNTASTGTETSVIYIGAGDALPVVTILSPMGTTGDIAPVVKWSASGQFTHYQIYIENTADASNFWDSGNAVGSSSEVQVMTLLDNGSTYSLKVRVYGTGGWGPWSDTADFTVELAEAPLPSRILYCSW